MSPGRRARRFRSPQLVPPTAAALLVFSLASPPGLAQEPAAPIAVPGEGDVLGTWQGSLSVPGGSLAIVVHVGLDAAGTLTATLDSPDQGARAIPVEAVTFEDGRLSLELRSIGAGFEGSLESDDRLVGFWSQGGARLPLELGKAGRVAARSRPQEPEPPLPYRSEDLRYPNTGAGIRLAGTLTLPDGDGPFPAVVLISGSGAQERDSEVFGHRVFLVLADHLTRSGIAVLRSDDRGVGESEGVFREATSHDFASDAAAAAAYLRRRPEVRADEVGLVGMSEGGLVAPLVAAGGDSIAFVVLLAGPGVTGEEILYVQSARIARAMGASEEQVRYNHALQEQLFGVIKEEEDAEPRLRRMEAVLRAQFADVSEAERSARGLTPEAEDEWIRSQLDAMGGPWFRSFLLHDPSPVLRRVGVPVLALNGELDLQVPPDVNLPAIEAALREGGNPDFTIAALPGLNHLFQTATTGVPAEYSMIEETMSPAAMELVARWILERTGRQAEGRGGP